MIRSQVNALVRAVEAARFVDAIRAWYDETAETHEPGAAAPTVGKPALLAKEESFLATVSAWHACQAIDVLVDGHAVAIHWRFDVSFASGERVVLEEVALQHWRGDGEAARIVREWYFQLPLTRAT